MVMMTSQWLPVDSSGIRDLEDDLNMFDIQFTFTFRADSPVGCEGINYHISFI